MLNIDFIFWKDRYLTLKDYFYEACFSQCFTHAIDKWWEGNSNTNEKSVKHFSYHNKILNSNAKWNLTKVSHTCRERLSGISQNRVVLRKQLGPENIYFSLGKMKIPNYFLSVKQWWVLWAQMLRSSYELTRLQLKSSNKLWHIF